MAIFIVHVVPQLTIFIGLINVSVFSQNLSEIPQLPGLENDLDLQQEVSAKTIKFKAYRWASSWNIYF